MINMIFIINFDLCSTEAADNMLVLRTKAMREKHELKEMKKYRYALIRIRFPDGILLQVHKIHSISYVSDFVHDSM